MLKKLLCSAAMMACAMSAHAEVKVFDFSYQNFMKDFLNVPDILKGRFSAEDKNGDGVYGASELLTFKFADIDFAPCVNAAGVSTTTCSIDKFSYQAGGPLNFSAIKSVHSDLGNAYYAARSGDSYGTTFWSPDGGAPYDTVYVWTGATQFSITAVPEPQTYLMFGAGLLALVGAARRRPTCSANFAD
ncbi:PEP-CTERM sorting domain-containing protein [Massilia antarctica]|uniref:PEP-CTERM sorting domain-containing protein n=1 Tax=Massilia antarctica TaxID=2765360 RepID=UPI0006BB9490|nr:PEP-CTERM sorting domain-containing protein [Massilia sp. H27-R4]MCY0912299.1 PEP-CTERM sorting domain-containing protein [Massilia sp. H27-R4]CUI03321.1 hypothetical protein BN2497_1419 [Janthinobacterium sp. CG23_2]CUU27107.1 hypothetical protein BN3177_1419 [Janthinobacterium sp. CG23_2]